MKQIAKHLCWLACLSLLAALSGCGSTQNSAKSTSAEPCDMLSPAEIQSIQGEAVASAKSDKRTSGDFLISSCFYTLPTYSRSVSVELTRPATASDVAASKDFWNKRFHNSNPEADEEEAERMEAAKNSPRSNADAEEEKERARPQAVSGLGDEAFWAGSQINGSLYIKRGTDIIRISIGGPDDQSVKIEKAKSLGERVLARL